MCVKFINISMEPNASIYSVDSGGCRLLRNVGEYFVEFDFDCINKRYKKLVCVFFIGYVSLSFIIRYTLK
jgi:hypothetical protein